MTNISGSTIYSIVSTISLVGGAILVLKSRIPKITIDNLVQLNDTYEKRIKALEEEIGTFNSQHLENVKAIADLQGQVKVYKDLPLQELAIGIQKVGQTNK